MKPNALDPAVLAFAADHNTNALLSALRAYFKIETIAPEIIPYLEGKAALDGYYTLQAFKDCYAIHFSYQKLFHRFGDDLFPAICFGSDGLGVEFWLMLASGQVITLHHDATFYEEAGEIEAEDGPAFAAAFAQAGSLFSLAQLLDLQARTKSLDRRAFDFGDDLFRAAAKALGRSLAATAKLFGDVRFEFVSSQLGDLVDDEEYLEEFLVAADD